jgi:FMN phosphatase YigB (HAD superfamily)
MEKPELIIFDLGRVLVDFDFKKVVRGLKRYTSLSEREIYRFFVSTPLWDAFERGNIAPEEFFKRISRHLALRGLSFKGFTPIWNRIFVEKPDTVAILRQLRGRYKLALLSNVNPMHWDYIKERHAFMDWFDFLMASCLLGSRKPEKAIYRAVLKKGGVSASRAVFIDDTEGHVLAARALGIRAYHFRNAQKLAADLDGILS